MGSWLFSTTQKCFSFLISFFAIQKTSDHGHCLPKLESPPPPLPPVAPFHIEAHQDQNPANSRNQPHSTTIEINNGHQPVVVNQAVQPQLANPIAEALREQDLGKAFLTMIPPLVTILLNVTLDDDLTWLRDVALCLLCLALVNLFYGICLSNMYPKTANLFRQVGIASTCTSVFMVAASLLPPGIVWLPIVSCVACTVMCIFGLDY